MTSGKCKNCNESANLCDDCGLCDDCHDEGLINEIMGIEDEGQRAAILTAVILKGPNGIEIAIRVLLRLIGARGVLSTIHNN